MTAVFSVLVAALGLSISLVLAVFADRVHPRRGRLQDAADLALRRRAGRRGDPLAVPVQSHAGRRRALARRGSGIPWDPLLDGTDALIMVVIAAVWKQVSYNFLFFLAGLQSIPKSLIEAAAIDGAGPGAALRRRSCFRCCRRRRSSCSSSTSSTRSSTRSRIIDAATSGGPGQGDPDPRLQGLRRRLQGPRPRRLGRAVGRADGDRHHAHRSCSSATSSARFNTDERRRPTRESRACGSPCWCSCSLLPSTWRKAATRWDDREPAGADVRLARGSRHRHRDRRAAGLHHVRRVDARGRRGAAGADAARSGHAPRRELPEGAGPGRVVAT